MRRRGSATVPHQIGVSVNGVGAWRAPGQFLVLGVSSNLVFTRRCTVRVRGKGAGGKGGSNAFASDSNGGGGGGGAVNDTGVVVTIEPGVVYTAAVGTAGFNAATGTTRFSRPGTTYLELTGGENGDGLGIGGIGGVATVGAGGSNGGDGASGFGPGSPAVGADPGNGDGGATGGAGNNGGTGGDGGNGSGQVGQPAPPGLHSGGCGGNGFGIVLTGDSVRAGYGGGGQGAGNVLFGEIGPDIYCLVMGGGRQTIEIISVG